MTTRKFEEQILPHLVHVACSAAVITLAVKILRKVTRINKGIKEIEEGHREMMAGREEILGRHGKKR